MLDDTKVEFDQKNFFDCVLSSIKNKKISHAYLIETHGIKNDNIIVNKFVEIIYSNEFLNGSAEAIRDGNYIEINYRNDSGITASIKKDDILEIQRKFSTKSLNDKFRIYVIYDADKLTKQAANSLLKFLEEPEENIIGILVASNRYSIIDTIRSRCQTFSLINKNNDIELENFDFFDKFIKTLEQKKIKSIAYIPEILNNEYYNKEKWLDIFCQLEKIYEKSLRHKLGILNSNDNLLNLLDFICSENDSYKILYKITVLHKQIERLEYNLNLNLMLDKFIIDFIGGD